MMIKLKYLSYWINAFPVWILVITTFFSCTESEYTQLVKRELGRGVIHDSLFLEFRFGQTRDEFYETGWKVNQTGRIVHGPKNRTVRYRMEALSPGDLSIDLLFFPDFDKNAKINKMDLTFRFTTWAIGHQQFNQDTLLVAAKDTLMSWYKGNEFILTEFETEPKQVWVKVDGNRRITLAKGPREDMEVKGVISDLSHPEISNLNRQ